MHKIIKNSTPQSVPHRGMMYPRAMYQVEDNRSLFDTSLKRKLQQCNGYREYSLNRGTAVAIEKGKRCYTDFNNNGQAQTHWMKEEQPVLTTTNIEAGSETIDADCEINSNKYSTNSNGNITQMAKIAAIKAINQQANKEKDKR